MNLKRFYPNARNVFVFLLLMLLVTSGVIAYTITVREDLGKIVPRVHMRYFCHLFLPVTVVFLSQVRNYKNGAIAAVLTAVAASAIFKGIGAGSPVDQLNLNYVIALQDAFPREWVNYFWHFNWVNLFRVMFIVGVAIAALLLRRRNPGVFIVSLIVAVSLVSDLEGVRLLQACYGLEEKEIEDAQKLTQIVPKLPGNVLAIMGDEFDDEERIIDTYANYPNVYITTFRETGKWKQFDVEHLTIVSKYRKKKYDGLTNIEYVIIPKSLNIQLAEEEFLQLNVRLNGFRIYQNLQPTSLRIPSA